jgi:predicted nucleic acid-binding protein
MIDINILLDVFLHRQPHYTASAQIVSHAISGTLEGVVSAHGLTTIYYLARKQADRSTAEAAVDHIIQHLHIASLDNAGWRSARTLAFSDFEDAVVAQVAKESHCARIVTRNTSHFAGSPVPAITPVDLLCLIPPPV